MFKITCVCSVSEKKLSWFAICNQFSILQNLESCAIQAIEICEVSVRFTSNREMEAIFNSLDFIFSKYFKEFMNFGHIAKLKLPFWMFVLVGILVILILLWIFLIVHGIKYFIYQHFVSRSRNSVDKRKNTPEKSFDISYKTTRNDEASANTQIWTHIITRKPTEK